MARIELPSTREDGSNNWIEYRDKLKAIDRFAVQEAVLIEVGSGGTQKYSVGAMANDMRNALLGRIITGWSFPEPIPANNHFQAADVVIGNTLDLEDYAVVEEAIQPILDLIEGRKADGKDKLDPKRQPTD